MPQAQEFLVEVKYHGATNHKGSRWSIRSPRFKKGITESWNYGGGTYVLDQAVAYMKEKGITKYTHAEYKNNITIVFIDWREGMRLFNVT